MSEAVDRARRAYKVLSVQRILVWRVAPVHPVAAIVERRIHSLLNDDEAAVRSDAEDP